MRVRDVLESALLGTLSICAVVSILIVRRELSPSSAAVAQPRKVREWRGYARGIETLGPANARDTIIVFSDFQCPFCAQLALSFAKIGTSGERRPFVMHRNLPISGLHPFARAAAIAGICAAKQHQFEKFYHRLFQHQDSIAAIEWGVFAEEVGVADTLLFNACLDWESTARELATDSVAAAELRITATPTMLVGPYLISGAISGDSILALLK